MKSRPCIRRGSSDTLNGTANPGEMPDHFRPMMKHGLIYWLFHHGSTRGVKFRDGTTGCLSCGLVWGEVPTDELREFAAMEDVLPKTPSNGVDPEL